MNPLEIEEFRRRYLALFGRLGATDPSVGFEELAAAYSEPQRTYHNLDHIARCLLVLDEARHLARRPDEVAAALFFHDVVYAAGADDNEEQSAILASRTLAAAGVGAATGRRVAEMILATTHRVCPDDPDAQLAVDVDLAGLGDPRDEFMTTGLRVRAEYPHLSDEDYRAGQRHFFGALLARESIYATPYFRDRLEARARANLKALIG